MKVVGAMLFFAVLFLLGGNTYAADAQEGTTLNMQDQASYGTTPNNEEATNLAGLYAYHDHPGNVRGGDSCFGCLMIVLASLLGGAGIFLTIMFTT